MQQQFTKLHRLNGADEFSSVFVFRKVKAASYFKLHYKPNDFEYSRLGLIVSKKVHKRSNRRNYMKRVIRELFRRNQFIWQHHDIIIRVNKVFTPVDFLQVQQEFDGLTKQLRI